MHCRAASQSRVTAPSSSLPPGFERDASRPAATGIPTKDDPPQADRRFAAGENALVIPDAVLDLPCRGADPVLASLVDRHAEDRIRSIRPRHPSRSLASEGTTYRALLDQLRHELAARHLANPRTSIAEVAFLLGFSDLSACHRAFKRWTGRTPAEFRRRT